MKIPYTGAGFAPGYVTETTAKLGLAGSAYVSESGGAGPTLKPRPGWLKYLIQIGVFSAYPAGGYVWNGVYGASADAGETDDPTVDASLYSAGNNYAIGAMVTDGSGHYYISEKDGNAGNALTDTTSWFALTAFAYIDFTSGVDDFRTLSTTPSAAKAAPFKTLSAMNNRTYSPSPTGFTAAPAGTLFLLKRGDSYGSAATGDAGNIQFEKNAAYAGCWGTRASARPVIHRRNNYQGPGQFNYCSQAIRGSNTNGAWRLRNINFNGDSLNTVAVTTLGGIAAGDTITGSTSGVKATVANAHTVVTGSASYLDVLMSAPVTAFTAGETITGSPSGGSTTANSFYLSVCMSFPHVGGYKILNSDIQNFPGDGVDFGDQSVLNSGDNTLLQNCSIHNCCNGGSAQHGSAAGFSTCNNAQILKCTFYDNSYPGNIFCHHVYNNYSTNSVVAYCNMYSTYRGANLGVNNHGTSSYCQIHHNWVHENENGISCIDGYGIGTPPEDMDHFDIYCNLVENASTLPGATQGIAFFLGAFTNSRVFDNVCVNNQSFGIEITDYATGQGGDTPSSNVQFYQNTFVNHTLGIQIGSSTTGTNLGPLYFENNIFYTTSSAANIIYKYTNAPDSSITLNNNLFYTPNTASPAVWDGTSYSIAGLLSAKSKGANSVITDPLFTNLGTGDYTLQSSSPAKGTGATGLGITTDFAGNTFTVPPNMGAYA